LHHINQALKAHTLFKLDVQTCFAGAPLLPSITNEIFFRMINTPSIRRADYLLQFND